MAVVIYQTTEYVSKLCQYDRDGRFSLHFNEISKYFA